MKSKKNLFLHEEIMLLALKDEEGTIASGTNYLHAIGGAVISELLLSKRIKVDDDKKKKVHIVDPTPLGDPLLDLCLERIETKKKPDSISNWIFHLANQKYKHIVAEELCRKSILRVDEDKVLLIFSRKIYPEVNPKPEKELMDRLHDAIFTETEDLDPRTVILLSLAHSADVLKANFDKKEIKARKKRIEKVVNGEVAGKATKEAIEAMQAAIMVATIIPAVMVATTTVTTTS